LVLGPLSNLCWFCWPSSYLAWERGVLGEDAEDMRPGSEAGPENTGVLPAYTGPNIKGDGFGM
jgi:hypothetical protein